MRHTARDLNDYQWKVLDPLIPKPKRRNDGRGRPWKSRRSVLNGILWVLRTGAPWADLPEAYPSFQTCHRRFQQWVRSGVMKGILEALALDLELRGAIDVREAFIDASFAPAKKGSSCFMSSCFTCSSCFTSSTSCGHLAIPRIGKVEGPSLRARWVAMPIVRIVDEPSGTHLVPRSQLGSDEVDDLMALCARCHRRVHNRE